MTRYYSAEKMDADDFGVSFTKLAGEIVYDARLAGSSAWATMTEQSFKKHGAGKLGLGLGQKYRRDENGHLNKVQG